MKPLLFLDVDGVLNCLNPDAPTRRLEVSGLPLWLPEGIEARISKLAEEFEIVWATAWFSRANQILPHLGIEASWPVLQWTNLKLEAIPTWAGERPWAWVDDDVSFELREFAEPFVASPHQLLLEVPAERGLSDEDVARLKAFKAACPAATQ